VTLSILAKTFQVNNSSKRLSKQDRKLAGKCPFTIPDYATAKEDKDNAIKERRKGLDTNQTILDKGHIENRED